MSQLKVNALVSYSGNTVTLGTSGDTINVASGVTFNTASATVNYPAGSITNAAINASAAIAYSKLNLSNSVVNADINSSAAIAYSKLSGNPVFRNIIINGNMQVAQRSTSKSSITSVGYYTLDRWFLSLYTLGTWTMSQSTDVPSGYGFANSLKLDCTTANASPAAGNVFALGFFIEGQNLQYLKYGTSNALSTTLSFWVKSTKTGTFIAELFNIDQTRQISKSYTVNASDTWEFKTITFEGDTTGTIDNDNNKSMELNFSLGAGTTYTSGTLNTSWAARVNANRFVGQVNCADNTANDFLITGVQLEAGTAATDFEFLPIDVNLNRCYRYYWNLVNGTDNEIGVGLYYSTTEYDVIITFPISMRAGPTLDIVTGTDYYKSNRNSGTDSFNSFSIARATTKSCLIFNISEISGTAGQAGETLSGNASAFLSFTAELGA